MPAFEGEIVITGISGRLPESSNIEEFKENLMKGTDMVTEDERRWTPGVHGIPSRIGKIKDLSSFDASFFKVHPKQAHVMDPQLRLMLEVTYETLIDAGINPTSLKKSRTGVFVGVSSSDANYFWRKIPNGYGMLGCSTGFFANRISYAFDLIGPSYTIDTGCSASLAAMHQAVVAIRTGECNAAIIGGMNLVLDPGYNTHFHKLNMLSEDGKCKAFDIKADGYVRSEAVVAIYLQKAMDARRVYATVMNTATNTDGYKLEGFTYPNGEMQYLMLKKIYSEVGIDPRDVIYVEAHGTGTKAGDSQELNAIDKLFCKNRETSLLIGSVKSNMGHSEPASGLCSIVKVLIAMESGIIPANLHFAIPNPMIPALNEGRIRVIDKVRWSWNGGLVGINSFGAGGVNSHVILRSNPQTKISSMPSTVEPLPKLVAVSGCTKEAVHVLLNKANEYQQDNEFLTLLHAIHDDNIPGHNIRGYEIFNHDGHNIREIAEDNYDEKRPIWFVFSGMGTQWSGMGRELLDIEICHRSLRQCADILKSHDIDLMDIIINSTDETYENVIATFVSIVAIQIALIDMLTFINVKPNGIVGHSVGELACSYTDGAFTLKQTILAAYYRGKSVVNSDLEPGAMAAIGLSWEEAKNICPFDINLACHNSVDSVTISGPSESVKKFVEVLKSKGIFAKMIKCSGIAFHSKYLLPAESKLRASFDMIIPKPKQRSSKWISSSIPETAWDSSLAQFSSSEYHLNNILSPVLFKEAISHIPDNAIIIEIAPHCLLQVILLRSLPSTVTNISLQKRNYSNNLIFLLSNIGKMYMAGAQPDISKLYPWVRFPVSRGTPMIGPLIKWDHSVMWEVPNFKYRSKSWSEDHIVEINLLKDTDSYLAGHKIDGQIIFPAAGFFLIVWKVLAKLHDTDYERLPVIFENVWFQRVTFISENKTVKFSISFFAKNGDFEIREADMVLISGNIRVAKTIEKDRLTDQSSLPMPSNKFLLNTEDVYKELGLRGYEYNGVFKGIKSCDSSVSVGELRWFNEWSSYLDNMFQFKLLSGDRKLVYKSKLKYTLIDPILHKQMVDQLSKDGGLPVYHFKNINIIKSGGIEIRGVKFITPQRQCIQIEPKYERYVFVPYENPHSLVLKDPTREKVHALTVLLQIVCENVRTRIKAVEIAGNRSASNFLTPLVLDILHNEPLVTIDLQVVASFAGDTANSNEMNGDVNVTRHANDIFPLHLIIAAEVLSGIQSYIVLKNLAAILTRNRNCFILLEETASQLDLKTALKEANLILVGKQVDSSGKSYFLLKKREDKREPIEIQITEKDFSWLENAKAALKKCNNENQEVLFVSQGEESLGIVGFITCIRREFANVRYVFIQDSNTPKFDLSLPFYAKQLEKGLMANVLKEGQWGSYRHLPLDQHSDERMEHAYVNTLTPGDLSSLKWIQSPLAHCWTKHINTLCSVFYASLNFRDIMVASGKLSTKYLPSLETVTEDDCALGLEFSGRDTNGCRVMGIVKAMGLATTVLPNSDFLWKVPDKWTLEQAATIPIAYVTSYYALFVRGRLKTGESVLIHDGTSDVGHAAIAIALHAGCTVFTTVDTLKKRLYLKETFSQLTDERIGDFEGTNYEQLILNKTQGRGVDVVMNSPLMEEKLYASVQCLATNGRFLEIEKYDMSNDKPIDISLLFKSHSFHSILLETLFEDCADKRETIRLVSEGIENDVVRPLPTTVFLEDSLVQGFRFMAMRKHIGKVLLKIRDEEPQKQVIPIPKTIAAIPRTYMNPEKSYLLIGGLGGFGLELADWMIARGARFIIIVSRNGIRTGYQALRVQHWRENGIKIIISTADITTLSGAEYLLEESNRLAPVGGIFNLAVVLCDALFENLQETDFKIVTLPKIDITRNLDAASRKCCPLLDYFVVFSSATCGRGNSGQSNYGLANSSMERMMEKRHAADLPGLAIQWSIIGDVGLYINTIKNISFDQNVLPQRLTSCLATIDIFLQQPYPVLSSTVIGGKHKSVNDGNKINFDEVISNILEIENVNSMNINKNFEKLGFDSLIYTKVKQILEREYNIILSFQEIRALTISKLRDLVAASDYSSSPDKI
ncbi:fatty acid synthase-like [Anoplolepis gracilipes]|uniref:fatty acid synthase-like n=1 Tax=Anoplolepis gracilipes TaxID=354296 RepID=UPI003BA21FDF